MEQETKEYLIDKDSDLKKKIVTDMEFLHRVSEPVTEFDENLSLLVKQMVATMMVNRGRGLAAVQIGVLQRVIIAQADSKSYVMVNPVFKRKLNRFVTSQEGCLSIPGKLVSVSRPAKCDVTFQDLQGNLHEMNLSGESAIVIQHEMDHLDGILITDK